MAVKASQAVGGLWTAHDATGANSAASSISGVFYANGVVDETVTVTITTTDAPFYKWSCTIPAGIAQGAHVQVCLTATIDGVARSNPVWSDSVLYDVALTEAGLSAAATAVDDLLTANHDDGSWAGGGGGEGAIEKTYTVTYGGNPLADVLVEAFDNNARTGSAIDRGYTNSNGEVKLMLYPKTTVYLWRRKAGYTFTNPDTEVVE